MSTLSLNAYTNLWNYTGYPAVQSLEATLCEIASAGYGVELPNHLFQPQYRASLKAWLGATPSAWHGRGTAPPIHAKTLEDFQEQNDTAAYLGSSVISVHEIGEGVTAENPDGNLDFARRVVSYAKERGVRIALETIWPIAPFQQVVAALKDLAICVDPACIYRHLDAPIEAYVEPYRDRICYLHLYDNTNGKSHLPPGAGDTPEEDWVYLLKVLRAIGFTGPAVYEVHPAPERVGQTPLEMVQEGWQYLEGLISRYLER